VLSARCRLQEGLGRWTTERLQADDVIAEGKERLGPCRRRRRRHVAAQHLDGSSHASLSPPRWSIGIQHKLGADIIFAFDELTTLVNTPRLPGRNRWQRTHDWAVRCLVDTPQADGSASRRKPAQALFGVGAGRSVRGFAQAGDPRG